MRFLISMLERRITSVYESARIVDRLWVFYSCRFRPRSCHLLFIALMVVAGLVSCGGRKMAVKDFDAAGDEDLALEAKVIRGVKPQPDQEVAVIETVTFGTIVIELFPNVAPNMVARFKQLINEGFYNGTTFHRVNPTVGIIQGGDPLSKDSDPENDGQGDSPYPNVPGEMSDIPFQRGTVGAARRGAMQADGDRPGLTEAQARETANCQFFITLKPAPQYDRKYTVFGRVVQGIDMAQIIMGAPVTPGTERPADKVVIKSITLQPRSRFVSGS